MPSPLGRDAVIVVQSHLRWDFVWQRPQQLLSRLAATTRVVFVEEPIYRDGSDVLQLDISSPSAGVTRVVPLLPTGLRDRYDQGARLVRSRLRAMLRSTSTVIHWFYTPMAVPVMLGAFNESVVVYDCMDELSVFRFAPTDLTRRERILLACADVVFTGGSRLYDAKSQWHDNVHFFGCGVDAAHFARARHSTTDTPSDLVGLPRPLLGYVGVIDERLDYTLLAQLARANRQATIVMVGPRAKVDERELPQEPNIRWVGQRSYDDLPAYLKSFDVCLMPFALNDATAYINPTKTLEYMAAGKPIVSTAIADVVRHYAPIVHVARSRRTFVEQCRVAMATDDAGRVSAGIARAERASWDSIVAAMRRLIADAMVRTGSEHAATAVVA